jgi:hypothetical protein
VSHEFARATVRFIGSLAYGFQFMKVWPSMTSLPVHWMSSSGATIPSSSAASAVIGLNTEPAG